MLEWLTGHVLTGYRLNLSSRAWALFPAARAARLLCSQVDRQDTAALHHGNNCSGATPPKCFVALRWNSADPGPAPAACSTAFGSDLIGKQPLQQKFSQTHGSVCHSQSYYKRRRASTPLTNCQAARAHLPARARALSVLAPALLFADLLKRRERRAFFW